MRSLKFNLVRAENILCFGPKGVEIHFADYGNIIQVIGINKDAPGTEEEPASNGTGKSSIQEILSIGLYGRTVKSPTKNKGNRIVNILAEKGEVEVQWDDYRVIRSFKKAKSGTVTSKLDLWKSQDKIWDDSSKMTFGTTDETQKFIEEKLGLSHHAFCNVVIFDDSNTYSFLEADTPTKRQIVENLLDLEQYRDYHENCKEILRDLKKDVGELSKDYEGLKSDVDACDRRISTVKNQEASWKTNKQSELKSLLERIKNKQSQLENSDTGAQLANWQKGQERIVQINDEITDLESKRDKIQEAIKNARAKVDQAREDKNSLNELIQTDVLSLKNIEADLNKALKLISDLEKLKEGTTCPTCRGTISRENYGHVLDHGKEMAEKCRNTIENKQTEIEEKKQHFITKSSVLTTMESKISEADGKVAIIEGTLRKHRNEISLLTKVPKPEGNVAEQVLEAEIVELKKQFKSKKEEYEGQSPYQEIIEQAEIEKLEKERDRDAKGLELQRVESEVPYFEYWLEAFSDNGIRKFVIDGIIPALNERIAYWLQILIDGLIELTFDNKLDETVSRNGNPAFYHNMSKGEVRRINLAVSQSFAYVMMLNSGACPSIVFLDEITGGGIDRAGVPNVYNMILELAKERQVMVTTHNEVLMNMLQGCESLTLKKQNDITEIVS
jgi:DNA repair exonuclease SbcCD ATPase subunit